MHETSSFGRNEKLRHSTDKKRCGKRKNAGYSLFVETGSES